MKDAKYTRSVAISMVIANMVGTGVFTSLGFQVLDYPDGIPNAFAILCLWFVGGIIALSGATVYAEIATTLGESGGEYVFLSRIYHRSLGFVSAWVSLVVGFGSAICLAAIAIGTYSAPLFGIDTQAVVHVGALEIHHYKLVSVIAVFLVTLIHLRGVKAGGAAQNVLTGIKVMLILVFLVAPFFIPGFVPSSVDFSPSSESFDMIFSTPFAGALVFVMLAYSGWNASAYIAGNLENPKRNLPFSLLVGTGFVMLLYLLLNAVFMYSAEFTELKGKVEIGNEIAVKLFGSQWGMFFSGIFSLALFSTMSAMVIAGPRVYESIGKDYSIFNKLAHKGKGGTPVYAILLQSVLAIVLILFSSFAGMVEYISITLTIFSSLTVFGIFLLRKKYSPEQRQVKAFAFPLTPIVFLAASVWMLWFFIQRSPEALLYTGLTILSGFVLYFIAGRLSSNSVEK